MDRHQTDLLPIDRIAVILHRPNIPENIGAVARGMMNTGFSKLFLSSPETEDWNTARRLSVSAAPLLDKAPRTETLEEALSLSEAGFIVGTTGRDRKYWNPERISSAAQSILDRASSTGVAIVFGPENTGLSNEELTLCNMTVSLPSGPDLGSYNLSHAVILVLFQIMLASSSTPQDHREIPAGFDIMEGMYGHIQEVLSETGFLWKDNPDHMMRMMRKFINRAEPTEAEATAIRGICRRLLWHLRNRGEAEEKSRGKGQGSNKR